MAIRRLKNGMWVVEPRRREFYGLIHQLIAPNALAAAAIGTQDAVQIDGQANFLLHATAAVYDDGQAKVNFVIQPDRNLFQVPVYIAALGIGAFPRLMAVPQIVPRAQTFTMSADDRRLVQVGVNNIRVLHIGQKVYNDPFEEAKAYRTVLPYDFVANFTANDGGAGALGANATNVFPVNVFSDSDFDIYQISIFVDGNATIQIETTGKALNWFNRACHVSLLGASVPNAAIPSGARPFKLPGPVRVPAAGSIVTTVADISAAVNRVLVIYHGLRMKPPGGLPVDPRSLVNMNVGTGA